MSRRTIWRRCGAPESTGGSPATELQNFRDQEEVGAGVLVTGVEADSKAARAGLRPGDVIVEANRQAIRDLRNLREAVRLSTEQILLRVYRSGRFGYIGIR